LVTKNERCSHFDGGERVKRFNDISTEPMAEARATPEAAHHPLLSEIDRWAYHQRGRPVRRLGLKLCT
jgi:hypothetical protein